jgi:hypothetical protein
MSAVAPGFSVLSESMLNHGMVSSSTSAKPATHSSVALIVWARIQESMRRSRVPGVLPPGA